MPDANIEKDDNIQISRINRQTLFSGLCLCVKVNIILMELSKLNVPRAAKQSFYRTK